ncbi:MAG: penicillin-binding protein activator [Nitrosomonadales bacterium]
MQRIFPLQWFCALLALYVSGFASATAETAQPPVPHIALLLPLDAPGLGSAARAVQQGIIAAMQNTGLPVRAYSNYDESRSVLAAYKMAIASGAVAVIGPLTRNGIRQLADEKTLPVPTLALNIIDASAPPQLYFFGLAVEAEARQIALLAKKQGRQQAIIITANDPLARRLQFAFEEQWTASGGAILREIEYTGDTMVFADVAANPSTMAFFATDIEKSRTIRPYLPNNMAAYATSQLFSGNKDTLLNFDFDGIRFVDMPWLMQTELPAVAAFPRAYPPLSSDQERLYALGIDAWRLINNLISNKAKQPLDGVTGQIRLNGQIFARTALPSLFYQGHAQAADAPLIQSAQLFPDQFKNASSVEAPVTFKP